MQVLEFYPDNVSCTQGCFGCPRSLKDYHDRPNIDSISDEQRRLVDTILNVFCLKDKSETILVLGGYLPKYNFNLFKDIGVYNLSQISISLGNISSETLGNVKETISILNKVLGGNSGDKDIIISGGIELVSSSLEFIDQDILGEIIYEYFKGLNFNNNISSNEESIFTLDANNIPSKIFTNYNVPEYNLFIQKIYRNAISRLGDISSIEHSSREYILEKYFTGKNQSILDNYFGKMFFSTLNFRGISAKRPEKVTFESELERSSKSQDIGVSVFPDKVMVYHTTRNIHIKELWFTYDEFMEILIQSLDKKEDLKKVIDNQLRKKL